MDATATVDQFKSIDVWFANANRTTLIATYHDKIIKLSNCVSSILEYFLSRFANLSGLLAALRDEQRMIGQSIQSPPEKYLGSIVDMSEWARKKGYSPTL